MNLRRLLARKAVYVVLTIFFIASLNFFLFQILPAMLSNDPEAATRFLLPRGGGGASTSTNTTRDLIIHEWGLDKSVLERYLIYLTNILQGNWGRSATYKAGIPVADIIGPRLAFTVIWVGIATALTMWFGLVLGRISGWHRGKPRDIAITLGGLTGYSMPTFWISLVLLFLFAYWINIFPAGGEVNRELYNADFITTIPDRMYHMVLPITTFVISNFAIFTLTLRNSLTDVLTEDFMLTARAKGLTDQEQLRRHALPNARLPVLTVGAFYFGWVLSGAILVEIVFGLPGVGRLEWDAVLKSDGPLLSAVFLLSTVGVVVANAVADVLYFVVDPRVREA